MVCSGQSERLIRKHSHHNNVFGGIKMSLNDMTNEEIIKLAAQAGADAAIKKMTAEKQQAKKERKNRIFRNTRILLENYRAFKAHSENAVYTAEEAIRAVEQGDTMDSLLNLMWDPNGRSDMIIKNIKESAIRTQILMAHIDAMLGVYQQISYASKRAEDRRRYDVLYDRYIGTEEITVKDIADKYFVDVRTVYIDLKTATNKLSQLLFGIDWE